MIHFDFQESQYSVCVSEAMVTQQNYEGEYTVWSDYGLETVSKYFLTLCLLVTLSDNDIEDLR